MSDQKIDYIVTMILPQYLIVRASSVDEAERIALEAPSDYWGHDHGILEEGSNLIDIEITTEPYINGTFDPFNLDDDTGKEG